MGMKGKIMIGFDNWFTLENVFGHEFCFSNAEIINAVANGLRGELVLEVQVSDLVKTPPQKNGRNGIWFILKFVFLE